MVLLLALVLPRSLGIRRLKLTLLNKSGFQETFKREVSLELATPPRLRLLL